MSLTKESILPNDWSLQLQRSWPEVYTASHHISNFNWVISTHVTANTHTFILLVLIVNRFLKFYMILIFKVFLLRARQVKTELKFSTTPKMALISGVVCDSGTTLITRLIDILLLGL